MDVNGSQILPDSAQTVTELRDVDAFGARLRHARLVKKMRLRDVADTVGCSESMMSKIECGKVMPSLNMLHRVAMALDTSIAALFNTEDDQDLVVYKAAGRQSVTIRNGQNDAGIRLERLIPYAANRTLEGNIHIIGPGASNGGMIRHQGEEVGYVISGEINLTVADIRHVLSEGDSFFFRSDLPHSYQNTTDRQAVVLWVNSPPTF
jgi:transcriptional regulator with XRE-family HTH domain